MAQQHPSRSAQGQIVTVARPVSFIAVCATTAPARLCVARGAEMPGSRARSAAGSAASRSTAPRRSAADSTRSMNGPCRPGAAPHSRPSCWKVREVATAVRGPSQRILAAASRSW